MRVFRDLGGRARASVRRRFLETTDGNVAMIFGLVGVIMIMAAGAGIDVARAVSMKTRLSSALDAAALAVGTQLDLDEDELEEMAQKYFDANYPADALGDTDAVQLVQSGEKISLSVHGSVDTLLLRIVNIDYFNLNVANEVTRSANNMEVSLVLDITGSMCPSGDCTKINNLKVAASDMVDMIVQDVQTPYYTKMAIVPYSGGVNVGTYAASVRGPITAPKTVTDAVWTTATQKNLSGATRANPVVVTVTSHGYNNGDWVWISDVQGMGQISDRAFKVKNKTTDTFQLADINNNGIDGSGYNSYSSSSGDKVRKCTEVNCNIRVTSAGHGFSNGDYVVIRDVVGMAQLNGGTNKAWLVSDATADSFLADGAMAPGTEPVETPRTSGGSIYCTLQGCQWHRFTNGSATPGTRVFQVSTCVSERAGANAFTDAAPSTTFLGRNYPASNNPCIANTITPLSADKATLKAEINSFTAAGSTAGHLGAAWGWYMISPNFSYLWPAASQPAAYGTDHLFKIVILMTDGAFNTFYCNDVISQQSTSGSGNLSDHKNCDSPNDNAFEQAKDLCDAMKASPNNVIVYTVGFDIGSDTAAQEIVAYCATSSDHDYYPATGAALKDDFQKIAQEISQLRLSQ
jgi:Flp pilus assembly protein TadG